MREERERERERVLPRADLRGGEEEGFFEAGGRGGLRVEGFTSPRINM